MRSERAEVDLFVFVLKYDDIVGRQTDRIGVFDFIVANAFVDGRAARFPQVFLVRRVEVLLNQVAYVVDALFVQRFFVFDVLVKRLARYVVADELVEFEYFVKYFRRKHHRRRGHILGEQNFRLVD